MEAIGLSLAQGKRRPGAQREIVHIIDRRRFPSVVIFLDMRRRPLAKGRQAALRTIHHDPFGDQVEVNHRPLTLAVGQLEASDTRLIRNDCHLQLISPFIIRQDLIHQITSVDRQIAQLTCLLPQRLKLVHRVGRHIDLAILRIKRQLTRQTIRPAILPDRRDVGILPVAHPGHGDNPVSRVRETDRRVMILPEIEPLGHLRLTVARKCLTVEIAHEILRSAATERATRIDIHDHHPFLAIRVAIDRQLDEIRALELVGLGAIALAETAQVFPILQVGRSVETHLLVGRDDHVPLLFRLIPEHLRIAEIPQPIKRRKHRIILIFRESTPVVGAVGHTLDLPVTITSRGIEGDQGILAITGAIQVVDHRAAREDMPQRITGDRRRQRLPTDQVTADRMTPVHIAPHRPVGIILEIEMIFPILIDQAVGVIHPAIERRVMINRAIEIGITRIERIGNRQTAPTDSIGRHSVDNDLRLAIRRGKLERDVIVHAINRQADIHRHIGGIALIQLHQPFRTRFLNRQQQISRGIINTNNRQGIAQRLKTDRIARSLAGSHTAHQRQRQR